MGGTKVGIFTGKILILLSQVLICVVLGATNNGNTNQNNPLFSVILQSLVKGNGQNVASNGVTSGNSPSSNIQIKLQQNNANINSASGASAALTPSQGTQCSEISIVNPSLKICPQIVSNSARPQQSSQAPALSLSLTDPSTLAALKPILSKYCSCNPSTDQRLQVNQNNIPSLTIPITFSSLQNKQSQSKPVAAFLSQSNKNMGTVQNAIQNQPAVILSSQETANNLCCPTCAVISSDPQQSPSYTIVLQPQQPSNPAAAQQCMPTSPATPYYPSQHSNQGSKKSSFKKLLPLLFDLLSEKESFGCPRNCNCGCYNFMPDQQFNSGYASRANYGEIYEPFEPVIDTEENDVLVRPEYLRERKSYGNCAKVYDSNEKYYDDEYEDTSESYYI